MSIVSVSSINIDSSTSIPTEDDFIERAWDGSLIERDIDGSVITPFGRVRQPGAPEPIGTVFDWFWCVKWIFGFWWGNSFDVLREPILPSARLRRKPILITVILLIFIVQFLKYFFIFLYWWTTPNSSAACLQFLFLVSNFQKVIVILNKRMFNHRPGWKRTILLRIII